MKIRDYFSKPAGNEKKTAEKKELDLKKYSREDLLELLVASEKQNQLLKEKLSAKKAEGYETGIGSSLPVSAVIDGSSLMDFSQKVEEILATVKETADSYLDSVRSFHEREEAFYSDRQSVGRAKAQKMLNEARRDSEALLKKTEEECWNMKEEAKAACESMKENARAQIESDWQEFYQRLECFYKALPGLDESGK